MALSAAVSTHYSVANRFSSAVYPSAFYLSLFFKSLTLFFDLVLFSI